MFCLPYSRESIFSSLIIMISTSFAYQFFFREVCSSFSSSFFTPDLKIKMNWRNGIFLLRHIFLRSGVIIAAFQRFSFLLRHIFLRSGVIIAAFQRFYIFRKKKAISTVCTLNYTKLYGIIDVLSKCVFCFTHLVNAIILYQKNEFLDCEDRNTFPFLYLLPV